MKRFLSWTVLALLYALLCFLASVMFSLGALLSSWIFGLPTILKILCFLLLPGPLFGALAMPVVSFPPMIISVSESLCESRKGWRYIAVGVYTMLSGAGNLTYFLCNLNRLELAFAYYIILGAALVFYQNNMIQARDSVDV